MHNVSRKAALCRCLHAFSALAWDCLPLVGPRLDIADRLTFCEVSPLFDHLLWCKHILHSLSVLLSSLFILTPPLMHSSHWIHE